MTIRLFLKYDGTEFNGWQMQNIGEFENPKLKTVQGTLNKALRKLLCDEKIAVVGSSRTDAGVHAHEYCASFETEHSIVPPEKIADAIKHLLPDSIVCIKSEQAPDGFNARFDTKKKTYKYFFYTGKSENPFLSRYAWHIKSEMLDTISMNEACQAICGTNLFDSFCTQSPASEKSTERTIFECFTEEITLPAEILPSIGNNKLYAMTITGDGFLYNMVRIIAGTMAEVGVGKRASKDFAKIIEARNRSAAGVTAPAAGLHLWHIEF